MTMNFGDLLGMIRQDYLDTLSATAADASAGGAVETETAHHQGTPKVGVTLWHDLTVAGRPVQVASEGVFQFPTAIQFGWGDALPGQPEPLQVTIQPFAWDAMPVKLAPMAGASIDPTPLAQWLEQWGAEPEPDLIAEDSPYREVAHSLIWHDNAHFTLDMGSAPLDAWQDLLEALLAANVARATFGEAMG